MIRTEINKINKRDLFYSLHFPKLLLYDDNLLCLVDIVKEKIKARRRLDGGDFTESGLLTERNL